jgi:hypothetical protein
MHYDYFCEQNTIRHALKSYFEIERAVENKVSIKMYENKDFIDIF